MGGTRADCKGVRGWNQTRLFRDSGQSMDIPENIFYTAAMVVFFNRGQHMSDGMTAEELAEKFVSHQLYGLAADKKRTPDS